MTNTNLRQRAVEVALEAGRRGLWTLELGNQLVERVENGQTTEEELRRWEELLERL